MFSLFQTRFRIHAAILGLFVLLALLLSWPLPRYLTTRVPGIAQWAFDESTFLWNAWYLKHSLVDNLHSPLHTELIYYPLGIDLILYTYNFFHALIAQPLLLAVNLPFASNVALLFSTALSGYGAFLLTRYLLEKDLRFTGRDKPNPQSPIPNHLIPNSLLPALIAGLLYAFASNRAVYAALGHYDMVTTQWIPFYALMLLRSLDMQLTPARRRKAAALAGIFFAFNGLAEMITALFLAIFTLIVVICWVVGSKEYGEGRRESDPPPVPSPPSPAPLFPFSLSLLTALPIIALVAFVLWSPVLIPILRQFITADFSLKEWGEAIQLSTDLWGWVTPTPLHPLWGADLVAALREIKLRALIPNGAAMAVGFRDINTVFIGWVTLAVALAGATIYGRRVRIWLWTALIFGLFTLGPFLQINGQYIYDLDGVKTAFPMPYALLHYIPIVKANRAPNRNSVLLMLAIAVLVGYGVNWLIIRFTTFDLRFTRARAANSNGWSGGSALAIGIAGLIVFEHLALPAPLSDARVPAVYAQIAADPNPVSVMHVPLGWRNSFGTWGPERTQLEYFQSVHGKPMLGGNISRAPDFKMDYFKRIPFFQALHDVQTMPRADVNEELLKMANAQAAELMYLYNVGYVLLMPPIPERYPYVDHWQASWAFAKNVLPLEEQPFWTGEGLEAYRIVQPAGSDQFRIDLGEPGTFPYRGEGWDGAEVDTPYGLSAIWADDLRSRLFVPLRQIDPAATYAVQVQVHPFTLPQSVALQVNETVLQSQPLTDEWQTLTWQLPGHALLNGLNRLELQWAQTAVPRLINPGNRQIGSTGVELPIDADLKAFAEGGFIALFDEAGDQQNASAGRRGINVTLLDQAGAILDQTGFDTTANAFESQKLAEYVAGLPEGQIVLLVSNGPAWSHLTAEALDSLRRLGIALTVEQVQNQFFAAAGVVGAQPGSAALVVDTADAFLRIGLETDRRSLAGAVDWVEVRRVEE